MRRNDVIRLHEGFLRHLPVAADDFRDVHRFPAVLESPAGKVVRHDVEVLLEGNRAGIEVDEDEAAPRADSRFGQAEVAIADVLEVPPARNRTHTAVELPAEAMKRAAEVLDVLVREQQLAPAMRAGIVECADRPSAWRVIRSDRPTTS